MAADYDPSTLYGAGYQADSVAPKALTAWEQIARVLQEHLAPHQGLDWCDVGCGGGGLVAALRTRGECALGLEGSREALGLLPVPVLLWDLRRPLVQTPLTVDIVTCFDTAEHVGAADAVVLTLTLLAREWIVFGAAPPGQDGLGHIDCRPPDDWTAKFARLGWTLDSAMTAHLRAAIIAAPHTDHLWWIAKNLHAYRRSISAS